MQVQAVLLCLNVRDRVARSVKLPDGTLLFLAIPQFAILGSSWFFYSWLSEPDRTGAH